MLNVEGQCKLRGYSNPKKHWKLKGCLCIKKTCKMTCSFSKIGSISPSLLHWSFLDLLWSGNPDWQNFDLKISFTMWFSHVIHMTKALPKQIDLPHATVAENWDFIHPGIGTVPSGMFHYQAELITTFCLQYFPGVFFLDSATSRRTFEAAFPFQILPRSFSIWVENPKSESWEPHQWNIMLFWGVFEVWSQLQNKGAALVIVTSCRFKI